MEESALGIKLSFGFILYTYHVIIRIKYFVIL